MKKYYKAPVTIVVTIEIQQMIASTILEPVSSGTTSVEVSDETLENGFFSSRGSASWDEDY